MFNCNNCIYNYNKTPCSLKKRVIKEKLLCSYYLEMNKEKSVSMEIEYGYLTKRKYK
jgi:hypothetical protein